MFKNIMLALERIENRQRVILEKLRELEKIGFPVDSGATPVGEESQWVQKGIDNILAYEAGTKKGGESA